MGGNFCITDNLLFGVTTGLYSVAVFIFGQQPELVAADIPAMGQPLGAASPAQHGLVQSGGQSIGQQPGAERVPSSLLPQRQPYWSTLPEL